MHFNLLNQVLPLFTLIQWVTQDSNAQCLPTLTSGPCGYIQPQYHYENGVLMASGSGPCQTNIPSPTPSAGVSRCPANQSPPKPPSGPCGYIPPFHYCDDGVLKPLGVGPVIINTTKKPPTCTERPPITPISPCGVIPPFHACIGGKLIDFGPGPVIINTTKQPPTSTKPTTCECLSEAE